MCHPSRPFPLIFIAIIACYTLLAACSLLIPAGPAAETAATSTSQPPEPSPAAPTPLPTNDSLVLPALAVVGPEQVVFDWSIDACEPEDIPDLPVRAFRDADGLVHLISAHIQGRASTGENLDEMDRDCRAISGSDHDPDPGRFNDSEWLASLYTEDGRTIYAIQHHEYHGWEHAGCPAEDHFVCWYNALTLAVSTDGGRNFADAGEPPDHFVAGLPIPYEAGAGPYGLFEPSNIVKGPDNFYYLVARVDDYRSTDQWLCLLRSDDLSNPASWRAWDGEAFGLAFIDPYRQPEAPRQAHTCPPVGGDEIGLMNASLTFNTFLDHYLMVGLSADHLDGREVWGIYYAFSDDLLNWTHRRLLWEVPLPWSYQPGDRFTILYPSLLDPASPSLNFETSGQQNWLYFTRFNIRDGASSLDRDLIRIPVAFFPDEKAAQTADARTSLSLETAPGPAGDVQLKGRLTTIGGLALEGYTIELAAAALDGPGDTADYRISGVVPAGAEKALIGFRVNTECGCSGEADFTIFEIAYRQEGNSENLVADPNFSAGLSGIDTWGEAMVETAAADSGPGNVLRVRAGKGQAAGGHLAEVTVVPGAAFSANIQARVAPLSVGSGYFLVLFTNPDGEILRLRNNLAAAAVPIGSASSDADGMFTFNWTPTPGTYRITADFAGDERRWPSSASAEIGVPRP